MLIVGKSNNNEEDSYAASLFITLKDHKCEEAIRMAVLSQSRMVRDAASSQGYKVDYVPIKEGQNYSTKPVQLYVTSRCDLSICQEILDGIDKLKFRGLELKVINNCIKGNFKVIYFAT